MSRTRWIRNKMLGALVLALGLVLALTSCSLFETTQEATGAGPTTSPTVTASPEDTAVQVEFPGREDLQASVEPVEQTPEMDAAMPSDEPVNDLVDITLTSGSFPDTGATVTFEIDQPLPEDAAPAVVHWNEELAEWEPLASELSADGKTLSADVEHFSKYGWVDGVYNWLNSAVGNFGDQPSCPGQEPEWADAMFHDDMNGPLLWCVGTDQKNSDILEVRVVANRSSAMLLSTAITPEWAWSDVLGGTGPETWAATALDLPGAVGPSYLLPPGGEYRFGFHKDKLFEFWRGPSDDVLIQADTTGASVVAGLAFNVASEAYGGKVAAVFAIASLAECGYTIRDLSQSATSASIMGTYASCLSGQQASIERVVKDEVVKQRLGKYSGGLVAGMRYAAGYYALVKGTLALGSLIGDATLPPIAFQLHFTPSTASLPEALGRTGTKTYTGEVEDAEFSFDHPAGWQVKGTPGEMNGTVTVTGPGGEPRSELSVLLVWGATCGGPVCEPRPVIHLGDVPGKQPLSLSGDFVARSVAIDLSQTPEDAEELGWEKPVRVVTSLTDAEAPVPTTLAAGFMYGVGQLKAGSASFNGSTDRVALFTSYRDFATAEEAREYARSKEHQDVQQMIASFRG